MATVAIVVGAVLCIVALVVYMFPPAVVAGQSMEPTYHDGDILLCRRVVFKNKKNYKRRTIVVYQTPEDEEPYLVIKRVSFCSTQGRKKYIYALGDNPPQSHDSRHYGFVPCDNIVAVALFTIKRCNHDG